MDAKTIDERFKQHPKLTLEAISLIGIIRTKAAEFAHAINSVMPDCREKSEALTEIEYAGMWAEKAAIAHTMKEKPKA